MRWEQVLTLLHIAHMTNEYPRLHDLRNAALDRLQSLDPAMLHFADEAETSEEDDG